MAMHMGIATIPSSLSFFSQFENEDFGEVLLPKRFSVTREALLMKISTVMYDTKLIKLEWWNQYCAVGKGGKDVHPNALLAVRVKTIIYLYIILLCCQSSRYTSLGI